MARAASRCRRSARWSATRSAGCAARPRSARPRDCSTATGSTTCCARSPVRCGSTTTEGLALPGGFLLTASGSDPLHVQLSGTFGEDSDVVSAAVALGLDLRTDRPAARPTCRSTPAGDDHARPHAAGRLGRHLRSRSASTPAGVRLVVTPDNVGPIQLLPTVSGLGELLGRPSPRSCRRCCRRSPTRSCRARRTRCSTSPCRSPRRSASTTPPPADSPAAAQAERLRSMLDPGWLQAQVTDPGAHHRPHPEPVPERRRPGRHRAARPATGSPRVEDRLRWEMDLFAGLRARRRAGLGRRRAPAGARVTLDRSRHRPVTIVEARLGYLDDFEGLVRARLEVGDPMDWFTPEIEFSLAGDRVGLRILPLGDEAADQVAGRAACPSPTSPSPPRADCGWPGSWLLPLLIRYVLPEVEALLEPGRCGPTGRARGSSCTGPGSSPATRARCASSPGSPSRP